MNEFLENLKRQAEANPMVALAVGATIVGVITKFIGTGIDARNSHAWAKEVSRRTMKDLTKM